MTVSTIRISQVEGYKFTVDFGEGFPDLLVDEAEPIGSGEGPHPEQMLVTSVANCLCASLVFALAKYRQNVHGLEAVATCAIERNAAGRLRVTGIKVDIALGAAAGELDRIDRVLAQFEDFCTVSESVKAGIPVEVQVSDSLGARLK